MLRWVACFNLACSCPFDTTHLQRRRKTTRSNSPVKTQKLWPDLNQQVSWKTVAIYCCSTFDPLPAECLLLLSPPAWLGQMRARPSSKRWRCARTP